MARMDTDGADREKTALEGLVTGICRDHGNDPAGLIEIYHQVQAALGHVPPAALPMIARAVNITRAEAHGVLTFYHDFRQRPAGRITVKLCRAEACQSVGALALIEAACARHGIALGETSGDGVTIEPVYCLGNCALGPAALVDGDLVGRVTVERLDAAIAEAGR